MKIIRYRDSFRNIHFGAMLPNGSAERLQGELFDDLRPTGEAADVQKLLAPIEAPPAILCIGLNYSQHAAESGMSLPSFPVLFTKGPNAIQHPGDPIEIPTHLASEEVDYECELAVVIGKRCKNASRDNALDFVLGYTCANDVSARDWQIRKGGSQWCRGKTFDTFCPIGPCIVTRDEVADPHALRIRTLINGETVQDSNTSDMIFDIPALIEFLSGSTTLLPGTIILTGTPQGVGMAAKPPRWLKPGDTVTIDIQHIGALTNPVINEA